MEYRRVPFVVMTRVGDEWIALNTSNGYCHVLNETAGWVISGAEDWVSIGARASAAQEQFDVAAEEDVTGEIEEVVRALQTQGLVELRATSDGLTSGGD